MSIQIPTKDDVANQEYHSIEVSYNGIGFEQVNADRIFNALPACLQCGIQEHGNKYIKYPR